MNNSPSDLVLFLGRFHPVLVHLPIGFIVLLAVLEGLAFFPKFKHLANLSGPIAALAVPVSLFSALCGWLLSRGGGYDPALLQLHMWMGFGVAAAALVTYLLRRFGQEKAYRVAVFTTVITLVVASHNGGSLTHGTDYLTRYAPEPIRLVLGIKPRVAPPPQPALAGSEQKPVFVTAVQPVFDKYCVSCHGPEKAKGDLRLDTLDGFRKGGESGPLVGATLSTNTPLLKRLMAPEDDEDRMPPAGKPQPTQAEIALIHWWLSTGAPPNKPASELNPPQQIQQYLRVNYTLKPEKSRAPESEPAVPKNRSQVLPLAEQLAEALGISISALSADEPWLQANASLAGAAFGNQELAKLEPLAPNLRWLDLAGTQVTDAGLAPVAKMKNLTRLHLERTALADPGLTCLSSLKNLEYLNLYGTKITDAGLESLKGLHKLRKIYLWQTQVTPEGAKAFGEAVMDKEQIRRWQEEIALLKEKIKRQTVFVDTGIAMNASPTNATPINTN